MRSTDPAAACSAIYHLETIERRIRILKTLINPLVGVTSDRALMRQAMQGIEDEVVELRVDVERLS